MANMVTDFFRSERLIYRNIEPKPSKPSESFKSESQKDPKSASSSSPKNEEPSLDRIFKTLAWDASQINASPALWQPPEGELPELLRGWSTNNMLCAVYMCLPVPAGTPGAVPDPANVGNVPEAASSSSSAVSTSPRDQYLLPIGTIHLSGPREPHYRFAQHRHGTIGINVAAAHQGKGYGGESIRWITDWGFKFAGLHRIKIQCAGWNLGAKRLYERCGFRVEGVEKEAEWFCGAWRDLISMAMLEREFWQLDWVKDKAVRDNDDAVIKMLNCH